MTAPDAARLADWRALAGAVETIKATGGAVEIAGVRIEPCDTYGATETTRERDALRAELSAIHATTDYQRWARAVVERDAAREQVGRVRALCDEAERTPRGITINGTKFPARVATTDIRAALDGGAAT